MKTGKHGNMETWKHGKMETWKLGNIEKWKHVNLETWKHGLIDFNIDNTDSLYIPVEAAWKILI